MPEPSEAHLSAEDWENVRLSQHEVQERHWPEIAAMQVPFVRRLAISIPGVVTPRPPQPKTPVKLFSLLGNFATELFDCEYRQYPFVRAKEWGIQLVDKITQKVMNDIGTIEGIINPEAPDKDRIPNGLDYHATYAEMRAAVRKVLEVHFQKLPKSVPPIVMLPPPVPQEVKLPVENPQVAPKSKAECAIERDQIIKAYFSSFQAKVFVMDMIWSSGEYPREWTKWKNGDCEDGSKPDKAFRAILTSGKHPREYQEFRTEPRPKGWGKRIP